MQSDAGEPGGTWPERMRREGLLFLLGEGCIHLPQTLLSRVLPGRGCVGTTVTIVWPPKGCTVVTRSECLTCWATWYCKSDVGYQFYLSQSHEQ